jgi:hypothetical protein
MKRTHGPALRRQRKSMMECGACRGAGIVGGVFHDLDCVTCDGTGWLCAVTGSPLALPELVLELNRRLRDALAEVGRARHQIGGAQQQYNENNRRGAGGTNYTGD